jgi:hypothetical protein
VGTLVEISYTSSTSRHILIGLALNSLPPIAAQMDVRRSTFA